MIPNVLSIAGSDPSGGAGIQADLKAIAANQGYGMAVITALTAQNTEGVTGVHLSPPEFVQEQISTVLEDVDVDAVKIGMLATARIAACVAEILEDLGPPNIVLDPVMVATSGDRLLSDEAVAVIRDRLLPLADVVTPNLPEAAVLTGLDEPRDKDEMIKVARAILGEGGRGPQMVLLKGGHLAGEHSPDLFLTQETFYWLEAPRSSGRAVHGGGCTLSSALATQLAIAKSPVEAARAAKRYVTDAIALADMLKVGRGSRPLHHFFDYWSIL